MSPPTQEPLKLRPGHGPRLLLPGEDVGRPGLQGTALLQLPERASEVDVSQFKDTVKIENVDAEERIKENQTPRFSTAPYRESLLGRQNP